MLRYHCELLDEALQALQQAHRDDDHVQRAACGVAKSKMVMMPSVPSAASSKAESSTAIAQRSGERCGQRPLLLGSKA